MVRMDVGYVFQQMGGPKALWTALTEQWPDAGLRYATVQMWQQRQAISQAWQMPVLYVMDRHLSISPLVCMTDHEDLALSA